MKEIFRYLQTYEPQIQLHQICCCHNPCLPTGSVIINVCAGCDRRFRTLYDGISTISLWELLCRQDQFPFPDYHGMEVSIHDPCPVRNTPAVHRAVRELLGKMNIKVVETEKRGENSICCGDSLYPHHSMEEIRSAMKRRADSMPCSRVVVYCVSCIKAMHICPSKRPLRENICFFYSAVEAVKAGFHPCKRCRSDLLAYHPMKDIAECIKHSLDELYKRQEIWDGQMQDLGLSRRRAVEILKEAYGMTPKAYMDSLRLQEAKRLLVQTDSRIIDIAAVVGFGGLSTFNRFFKEKTGCSPNEYRKRQRKSE